MPEDQDLSLTGRKKKPAAAGMTTAAPPQGMLSGVGGGYGAFHAPLADVASGKLLQENPYLQSQVDALHRSYRENVLPTISKNAEAAGRFGSGAHQLAQGRGAEGLASAEGGMRFQDYNARMGDVMDALGQGTARDIAKLNAETQAQSARDAANAANAGAAAELEYRKMALQQEGELASMGMLGDLAGLQSGTMSDALGMIPGLDAISGFGGYGDLFGQSNDLAGIESNYDLGGRELDFRNRQLAQEGGLARMGMGIQNRGLDLEEAGQRYQQERDALDWFSNNPYDQLAQGANIISGLGGRYGTTETRGTGQRGNANPTSAGISGALGGLQIGSAISNIFGNRYPGYDPYYGAGGP